MDLIFDILTLGAPKAILFIADSISQEARRQFTDTDTLKGELMMLQQRFDAGEIGEEEYDKNEKIILDRLKTARDNKTAGL
jgi:hypothetical protein